MSGTEVLFLNHASVLIKYRGEYLLCDPWYEQPAFGSWLPIPSLFCHPAYLSALGPQLRILISHAHDDHCDDKLLKLFDPQTPVVSSNYASDSVRKRAARSGLLRFFPADRTGVQIGPFRIKSFRDETYSGEDALYTIATPDALIIHANDLWNAISKEIAGHLRREIQPYGAKKTLYMSQTNSSSGFPITYRNFSLQEKRPKLEEKVNRMISQGVENAMEIGAGHFLSYAGLAGVYVKDHPEYWEANLYPTPTYIKSRLADRIGSKLNILDMLPGDAFDYDKVVPSFFRDGLEWERWLSACDAYYREYGVVEKCVSYRGEVSPSAEELLKWTKHFLEAFDRFVVEKANRTGFHRTAVGKTFCISVTDQPIQLAVRIGDGLQTSTKDCDKTVFVSSSDLWAVVTGKMPFEYLYTGYLAEFSRRSESQYNRDLISYLVLFSYQYRPLRCETP